MHIGGAGALPAATSAEGKAPAASTTALTILPALMAGLPISDQIE